METVTLFGLYETVLSGSQGITNHVQLGVVEDEDMFNKGTVVT